MADTQGSGGPDNADLLDGWKAIAAHIGKSVRTAQRYHRDLSLPVHHRRGLENEGVFALRRELDAWQLGSISQGQTGRAAGDGGEGTHRSDAGSDGAGRLRSHRDPRAESTDARAVSTGPAIAQPGSARARRTVWVAAIGLSSVAVITVTTLLVLGRLHTTTPLPARSGQPARYKVNTGGLLVFDVDRKPLWTYRFPAPLAEGTYLSPDDPSWIDDPPTGAAAPDSHQMPSVQLGDVDGDGNTEVLMVARFDRTSASLYCFGRDGKVRWTYRSTQALSFGGQDYGTAERVNGVRLKEEDSGPPSIWVQSQHTSLYPSLVERLNGRGKPIGSYWSDGHVISLNFGRVREREWAFFGGANNERRGATLAVIDPATPSASAPAEKGAYRCDGCPAGHPAHFIVFPSTCLSSLAGGMAAVSSVVVGQSGQMIVNVRNYADYLPGDRRLTFGDTIYTLSPDFRLVGAEFFSQYAAMHRYYETVGRLTHPFSLETHRPQLFPVVEWNGRAFVELPLQAK